MSDDYSELLNSISHYRILSTLESYEFDYNKSLTFDDLQTYFGELVDNRLSGPELLDDIQRKLTDEPKPEFFENQKFVAEKLNQQKRKSTESPVTQKSQQTPITQRSTEMTSKIINIESSINEYESDQRLTQIPPITAVILYGLTTVSIGGLLSSQGTPYSIAIAFGIALSVLIPSIMPPSENLQILSGVSIIGWLVILFSGNIGLDVGNSPEVVKILTDGTITSLLIGANMVILSLGVTALCVVDNQTIIIRRMANNIAIIGLMFMIIAIILDDLNEVLLSATGSVVGLWAIIALGQSNSISLRRFIDVIAILGLFVAMYSINSEWSGDIFLPLLFSLIVCSLAILAPNMPNIILSNSMLATSSALMIFLSMSINSGHNFSIITHFTILILVLIQLEIRFRKVTKQPYKLNRILSPDEKEIEETIELKSDVTILGFMDAGKTSYLGALWLLLDNKLTKELWYGTAKFLTDDSRQINFSVEEIKELIDEPLGETESKLVASETEKEILTRYLLHREAKTTLRTHFENRLLADRKEGFPFIVKTDSGTRDFLNGFIRPLSNINRNDREKPTATSEFSDDLNLTIQFNGEMIQESYQFFGLVKAKKEFKAIVRNTIRSRDTPGEQVNIAVKELANQKIRSKSIHSLVKNIEDPKKGYGTKSTAMKYVVQMTALYEHVFFIADVDKLTSPTNHDEGHVASYLRLADELSKLEGAKLKQITVLLNKSDTLIKRDGKGNRNMPNSGIDDWKQLLDQDLARSTLEEIIGTAEINSIKIPLKVYFCCTFGGLILRDNNVLNEDFIPTYPLVPINVMEPLIDILLQESELHR